MEIYWENRDFELNLCLNYRNLKDFVNSEISNTWIFKGIADQYIEQIRLFSKVELSKYLPEDKLEGYLEFLDYPLPIKDKHFFSHLALQLTFCKDYRLLSILDYHFKTFSKQLKQGQHLFLNGLKHLTCNTLEHNQILDYQIRLERIFIWIREHEPKEPIDFPNILTNVPNDPPYSATIIDIKYEYHYKTEAVSPSPKTGATIDREYGTVINTALVFPAEVINRPVKPDNLQDSLINQRIDTRATNTIQVQTKASANKAKEKIALATTLNEEQLNLLFEIITNHTYYDKDIEKLKRRIRRAVEGETISMPFIIVNRKLTSLCEHFKSLTQSGRMFSKEVKANLAKWMVNYFKTGFVEESTSLTYSYVYKILKGSTPKKSKRVR